QVLEDADDEQDHRYGCPGRGQPRLDSAIGQIGQAYEADDQPQHQQQVRSSRQTLRNPVVRAFVRGAQAADAADGGSVAHYFVSTAAGALVAGAAFSWSKVM